MNYADQEFRGQKVTVQVPLSGIYHSIVKNINFSDVALGAIKAEWESYTKEERKQILVEAASQMLERFTIRDIKGLLAEVNNEPQKKNS